MKTLCRNKSQVAVSGNLNVLNGSQNGGVQGFGPKYLDVLRNKIEFVGNILHGYIASLALTVFHQLGVAHQGIVQLKAKAFRNLPRHISRGGAGFLTTEIDVGEVAVKAKLKRN